MLPLDDELHTASVWYVKAKVGEAKGPFSLDQIKGYITKRIIRQENQLRIGQTGNWQRADAFASLQHLLTEGASHTDIAQAIKKPPRFPESPAPLQQPENLTQRNTNSPVTPADRLDRSGLHWLARMTDDPVPAANIKAAHNPNKRRADEDDEIPVAKDDEDDELDDSQVSVEEEDDLPPDPEGLEEFRLSARGLADKTSVAKYSVMFLRWIAMLPASILAALILPGCLNWGWGPLNPGAETRFDLLFRVIGSGAACGYCFVMAGAFVAPLHQKVVAVVLGVLAVLIGGFFLFPAIMMAEWQSIVFCLCIALGGLGGAAHAQEALK